MDQKRVTLIVSDLHMGDGGPGDDFVDDRHQFATFVRAQAATPEGRGGQIELIVNGDFLEMVQVFPEAYKGDPSVAWCSETESIEKLARILKGHPAVFDALAEFQALGNQVTLFPGNHDVDLYWPAIQAKLGEHVPGIRIENEIVYARYGGRLRISHGHLLRSIDPANGFEHPNRPIVNANTPPRLEICPGTLFMVKFVNLMEEKYPFADNLSPVTAIIKILAREDRWGLTSLAWMFTRFGARYPSALLGAGTNEGQVGAQLLNTIQGDKGLRQDIAGLCKELLGRDVTEADIKQQLSSEDAIADLIGEFFRADPSLGKWISILDTARPGTLSMDDPGGGTLTIIESGNTDARAACTEIASNYCKAGAEVFVLGHTHLPQDISFGTSRYYNPGSWTRYVESTSNLTLEMLEDESKFPYALNFVRVEDTGAGPLKSEMLPVEKRT